jgi:diphthamide synthase subunit DPH2
MCNNDFDNLSSPIVALRQFFTRRIALNERSLDAEDTGIVINTVKITRNLSVEDVINKFAVRKNRRLDFI